MSHNASIQVFISHNVSCAVGSQLDLGDSTTIRGRRGFDSFYQWYISLRAFFDSGADEKRPHTKSLWRRQCLHLNILFSCRGSGEFAVLVDTNDDTQDGENRHKGAGYNRKSIGAVLVIVGRVHNDVGGILAVRVHDARRRCVERKYEELRRPTRF